MWGAPFEERARARSKLQRPIIKFPSGARAVQSTRTLNTLTRRINHKVSWRGATPTRYADHAVNSLESEIVKCPDGLPVPTGTRTVGNNLTRKARYANPINTRKKVKLLGTLMGLEPYQARARQIQSLHGGFLKFLPDARHPPGKSERAVNSVQSSVRKTPMAGIES